MSAPQKLASPPVNSKAQLVEDLENACTPQSNWRIGTEHEKFAYNLLNLQPLPYDGVPGIRALLEGMQRFGWMPVLEGENVIALKDNEGASVTLEPGGQFELSGAAVETLHQTCAEVNQHLTRLRKFARKSAPASSGSASTLNGAARTFIGCRRVATKSCAPTCQPRAISATT